MGEAEGKLRRSGGRSCGRATSAHSGLRPKVSLLAERQPDLPGSRKILPR